MVRSCEERRTFWRQLKGIAGELNKVDVEALVEQTKREMAARLSSTLLSLAASGDAAALSDQLASNPAPDNGAGAATGSNGAAAPDYEPVWIETHECTACDECTTIAPGVFRYNEEGKAEVIDPKGGSYKDIVRAAEKCTAGCLHPGTPWNRNEKEIDKWIKRAEKYQ
jgi:pyruvate-ferredoxin/flavodoxin oxidoreductase